MMACSEGVAMEMERSGWIWHVFCNRQYCIVVSESCTHTYTFSLHDEHSLKRVCWIMRLLAVSEKTTVSEVRE